MVALGREAARPRRRRRGGRSGRCRRAPVARSDAAARSGPSQHLLALVGGAARRRAGRRAPTAPRSWARALAAQQSCGCRSARSIDVDPGRRSRTAAGCPPARGARRRRRRPVRRRRSRVGRSAATHSVRAGAPGDPARGDRDRVRRRPRRIGPTPATTTASSSIQAVRPPPTAGWLPGSARLPPGPRSSPRPPGRCRASVGPSTLGSAKPVARDGHRGLRGRGEQRDRAGAPARRRRAARSERRMRGRSAIAACERGRRRRARARSPAARGPTPNAEPDGEPERGSPSATLIAARAPTRRSVRMNVVKPRPSRTP